MSNRKLVRKIGCLSLATLMGVTTFVGCGQKQEGENKTVAVSGTEELTETTTGDKEGELEPVELTWYVIGTPQDDQQSVTDEINKILKEKLNTTLNINVIDWGSYDEKMKIAIATNEEFDMCFTSDWANPYVSSAMKGAFLPLDDLLDQYGPNIKAQVPESYWDAVKIDGKTYGVINYQISARIPGISFPKDIAEKYSLDTVAIKKLEDLEPYFETIKQNEPNMVPFQAIPDTNMPVLFNQETGFTIDYIGSTPLAVRTDDKDLKVFNAIESPEFMAFCERARDWYEKGYIKKDAASIKDYKADVKTGKYAAFLTGVGPGSEEVEGANAGFPIVQAQHIPAYLTTGSIQAALTAISKTSKHPERAMQVLDLIFADKELYNLFSYGIKGKHYKEVNDYAIELIPEGGYNPGIPWCYGSWFNAKLLNGQEEDLWDQLKNVNETAAISPLLGFVYNSEAMKSENAQIMATLSEYLPGLITGTLDPEKSVPELIEKLKKVGIDKVMEDAQNQITTWLNNK